MLSLPSALFYPDERLAFKQFKFCATIRRHRVPLGAISLQKRRRTAGGELKWIGGHQMGY